MTIVKFACGANIETAAKAEIKRYAVFTTPNQGGQRPQLGGKGAPCLYGCPKKRASKRQQKRCVFGEDTAFHPDNFGWLVTCVPVEIADELA